MVNKILVKYLWCPKMSKSTFAHDEKEHIVVAFDLDTWVWKVFISWQNCSESEVIWESINYFQSIEIVLMLKGRICILKKIYRLPYHFIFGTANRETNPRIIIIIIIVRRRRRKRSNGVQQLHNSFSCSHISRRMAANNSHSTPGPSKQPPASWSHLLLSSPAIG